MEKDFIKLEAEICLNCPYKKCICPSSGNGCEHFKKQIKKIKKEFKKKYVKI